MDWKIEVIVVPVSDLDRAKHFYAEQLGFNVDHDSSFGEGVRIVQFTPPGSGCSIVIHSTMREMAPGSLKGAQFVVDDVEAARKHLMENGVEATPVRHIENGEWLDGHGGPWNAFVFFSDPDGNSWVVQEKPGVKYMVMMFGSEAGMAESRDAAWIQDMIRFMHQLNDDLVNAGELVATEGLVDASQAKTVRPSNGTPVATDGPFAESKESLAGYWIVDVPDEARAIDIASRVVAFIDCPVEVRRIGDAPPDM